MAMKAKLKQLMSYRNRFIVIIACVVVGVASIVTSSLLSKQLREKEKNEVALWAYAVGRFGEMSGEDPLVNTIINNHKIPFIITDERGNVRQSLLIPEKIINHPDLRNKKILELAERNQPIEINSWNGHRYMLFYDNSSLLSSLLLFPYIQIAVIAVFATLLFISFRSTKEDQQNRVWIGMAKETAHQLGTPISSLLGWIEYLRSQEIDSSVVDEMQKDLTRLMKVADRFSKIGSETDLSPANINEVVGNCVLYFRTRVPRNVTLTYNGLAMAPMQAMINSALFEWVVENLLKNALDALQGQGSIDVHISETDNWVYVDVKDTGKGIAKANIKRIFDPGFTTKTRGWGLGLSLSKRIVEEYHKGKIGVLESEVGKGTTIRIAVQTPSAFRK